VRVTAALSTVFGDLQLQKREHLLSLRLGLFALGGIRFIHDHLVLSARLWCRRNLSLASNNGNGPNVDPRESELFLRLLPPGLGAVVALDACLGASPCAARTMPATSIQASG
jgi:hypothetical protein